MSTDTPTTNQCSICLDGPPYDKCIGLRTSFTEVAEAASCAYLIELEAKLAAAQATITGDGKVIDQYREQLASVTEERDRLRDEQFLSRGEALRAGFDGGRINEIVAALRDERDSLERALEEARNSEPDIALMEIGHLVKAKEGEHVLAAVHRLQENYQRIIVEVVACKPGQKVMVIEQPWDVIARMRNERNLAEQQLAASREVVWIVWSHEHHGYWPASRCGYVQSIADAGQFSYDEALAIVTQGNYGFNGQPEETMMPIPEHVKRALSASAAEEGSRG